MARGRVSTNAPDFIKTFNRLASGKYSPWQIWSDFIIIAACTISNAVDKSHFEPREKLYMERMKVYEKDEQYLFSELFCAMVLAIEDKPEQDFLGNIYMQMELGNKNNGQFFTPYEVCRVMAELQGDAYIETIEKKGYVTIHDCAVGAGATLIAGIHTARKQLEDAKSPLNWQDHILCSGQELDMATGLMCYIQLSLLGCAGYVKIGNTLSDPMTTNDDKTNYWYTPMYFSEVWHFRRIFHRIDALIGNMPKVEKAEAAIVVPEEKPKETPKEPTKEVVLNMTKTGQLTLF